MRHTATPRRHAIGVLLGATPSLLTVFAANAGNKGRRRKKRDDHKAKQRYTQCIADVVPTCTSPEIGCPPWAPDGSHGAACQQFCYYPLGECCKLAVKSWAAVCARVDTLAWFECPG